MKKPKVSLLDAMKKPPDPFLEETAFHEAGHAVAAVKKNLTFESVSIVPNIREGSAGHSISLDGDYFVPTPRGYQIDVEKAQDLVIESLAGFAAQMKHNPKSTRAAWGAAKDFDRATQILIDIQQKPLFSAYQKKARAFVKDNWNAITMVARDLLEKKRLRDIEVTCIVAIAQGEDNAQDLLTRWRRDLGISPSQQFPGTRSAIPSPDAPTR